MGANPVLFMSTDWSEYRLQFMQRYDDTCLVHSNTLFGLGVFIKSESQNWDSQVWQEWLQQQATTTSTTRTITTTSTAAATTSTTKATKGETEFSPAFETATFSHLFFFINNFEPVFDRDFFCEFWGWWFSRQKKHSPSWGDTRLDYYQCKSSYWRHGGRSGGHCNVSRRLRKCEFVALWEVKFAEEQNTISRWREIWIESLS